MKKEKKIRCLEKIAFGFPEYGSSNTVGISNPPQSVGDVLSAIGIAQTNDIGTSNERRDAFGRIIDSGLKSTSPAGNALRMIGGGILGRALTSAFTHKPFFKGLGTGLGAIFAKRNY